MKTIKLEKVSIKNFNGIASLDLNFEDNMKIIAPSGEGKTSVLQAIQYACGIDVAKIYPTINKFIIKDLETKVVLNLKVDDYNYVLERSNKQKWATDKILGTKIFKGNESECIFDGEPTSITNYKSKIISLFGIDVDLLPLLLDVSAFNNLHWEGQRKILSNLLHLDAIVEELNKSSKFNLLIEDLAKGKSEVDIQKVLNVLKKNIEMEQKQNQILIEDKANQVNELAKNDFESIEKKKASINEEKESLILQSKEANKNNILEEKKLKYEKLKNQLFKAKTELDAKNTSLNAQKYSLRKQISDVDDIIDYCESRLKKNASEIEDANMEIIAIQEEEFDKNKTICPTCKRELEKDKIEELLLNFEAQKQKRLSIINSNVENMGKVARDTQNQLNTQKEKKQALEGQLETLNQIAYDDSETRDIETKANDLFNEIQTLKEKQVESVVNEKIKELNAEYDNCIRELAKKDLMLQIQNQIQTLRDRSVELAVQDQQRILKQNQLFEYIKEKIALVNKTVNQNFNGVEFIFFTPLTSNADKPYEITCTVAYNGVEYQKCSTGQKILANCRVFEGLEKLLGVNIFKFVDERQSTTLELGLQGQVIELITSKELCNFRPSKIQDIYTINDTDNKNF